MKQHQMNTCDGMSFMNRTRYIKNWVNAIKQTPVIYQEYKTGPKKKLNEFADIVGWGTTRDCNEAQR